MKFLLSCAVCAVIAVASFSVGDRYRQDHPIDPADVKLTAKGSLVDIPLIDNINSIGTAQCKFNETMRTVTFTKTPTTGDLLLAEQICILWINRTGYTAELVSALPIAHQPLRFELKFKVQETPELLHGHPPCRISWIKWKGNDTYLCGCFDGPMDQEQKAYGTELTEELFNYEKPARLFGSDCIVRQCKTQDGRGIFKLGE